MITDTVCTPLPTVLWLQLYEAQIQKTVQSGRDN